MSIVYVSLSITISLLFLLTATDKILNWNSHIGSIISYQIINNKFIKLSLLLMILGEYFISLTILIWDVNIFNAAIFLLLILTYTLAVIINLIRGNKHISCGCGSILESNHLSMGLVYRNLLLVFLFFVIYIQSDLNISHLSINQLAVSLMISASTVLLWGIFNEINFSKSILYKIVKIMK